MQEALNRMEMVNERHCVDWSKEETLKRAVVISKSSIISLLRY